MRTYLPGYWYEQLSSAVCWKIGTLVGPVDQRLRAAELELLRTVDGGTESFGVDGGFCLVRLVVLVVHHSLGWPEIV